MKDLLSIGLGMERLMFVVLMFFMVSHIVGCIHPIEASLIGTLKVDSQGNIDTDYSSTWYSL